MKVLFAGNNERGIECLKYVSKKHNIVAVIGNKPSSKKNIFIDYARSLGLNTFQPRKINDPAFLENLKSSEIELIILAGYSQIVDENFIKLSKNGCINLHAGLLPNYRGSSPMNWALINGEKNFSLSIIKVDKGIDTGDILIEKSIKIDIKDSINDLHKIANKIFPKLLDKVISNFKKYNLNKIKQKNEESNYFPLRFPSDGVIFFDQLTALEIHNRIRALSPPYPGAYTFYKNKKIKLIKSALSDYPFHGEAGRIYKISEKKGILVCANNGKPICVTLSTSRVGPSTTTPTAPLLYAKCAFKSPKYALSFTSVETIITSPGATNS